MNKIIRALTPPLSISIIGLLLTQWFAIFGIMLIAFGLLDTWGRYRDFLYLSKFNHLPARMIDYYGHSFCGRWVVITLFPMYRAYYWSQGYQYWHVLPDNFPQSVLNCRFWRSLFLGQRY
jgi:hypothetical protein